MKKIIITVAIILVVLGIVIFGGAFALAGFSFKNLATRNYEEVSFDITSEFEGISVDTDTADVIILPSEDGKSRVTAYQHKELPHTAWVDGGVLRVEVNDRRGWYNFINLFTPEENVKVYLPESYYKSLNIEVDTGDVRVPSDFTFGSIKVDSDTGDIRIGASSEGAINLGTDTGDVEITSASAGSLVIEGDTGDVNLDGTAVKADLRIELETGDAYLAEVTVEGSLNIENDTGDVDLKRVSAKGGIRCDTDTGDVSLVQTITEGALRIETDTGDVELEGADGKEIYITTSTGDVEGSILTEKVFITDSSTGKIRVPSSISGGRCEVRTSTGDIILTIK